MDVHRNARLSQHGRAEVVRRVEAGQPPKAVATAFGVDVTSVAKWVRRFVAEGLAGLLDRLSRPHRLHRPTPAHTIDQVIALRCQCVCGWQIARETGVSLATVSRILRTACLGQVWDLDLPSPVVRYEREHPRELIHSNIKKLGRFEKPGHRVAYCLAKAAVRPRTPF